MGAQAAHMALSIDDLFAEEPCPAAARKQLFKLLAAYNSELRVVYEKYRCRGGDRMVALLQGAWKEDGRQARSALQ